MQINYCTLFNANYVPHGILSVSSLLKSSPNAYVYILAFDEITVKIIREEFLNTNKVKIMKLSEFENKRLKSVKKRRSATEYFWTCASNFTWYCLETFKLENCCYFDADLYFYSNPAMLINEMGCHSVLITPHRFPFLYKFAERNGKYCVQFMFFKGNDIGKKILLEWKNDCLEWCYNRIEENRFGDQKYLDAWEKRYGTDNVFISQHEGGGVAPWNAIQYSIQRIKGKFYIQNIISRKKFPLIYFHFHGLKTFTNNFIFIGGYFIPNIIVQLLYKKYAKLLYNHKIKLAIVPDTVQNKNYLLQKLNTFRI